MAFCFGKLLASGVTRLDYGDKCLVLLTELKVTKAIGILHWYFDVQFFWDVYIQILCSKLLRLFVVVNLNQGF